LKKERFRRTICCSILTYVSVVFIYETKQSYNVDYCCDIYDDYVQDYCEYFYDEDDDDDDDDDVYDYDCYCCC